MKEYILRIQGEQADIEPIEDQCEKCADVEDLEKRMREIIYDHKKAIQENDKLIAALMEDFDALKACIEDQRDELADMKRQIAELKGRIKELEGRPYSSINEPATLPYNPGNGSGTPCTDPWWVRDQFTCKQ